METDVLLAPVVGLDAVERELHHRRWHLRFASLVEARFEADGGRGRVRELVVGGAFALLVFDLFLIGDRGARPEAFVSALAWRLGAVTGSGVVVLAAIIFGLRPAWREGLMAGMVVVTTVASGAIFLATTSPLGVFDPFGFSVIMVAGNVGLPLRYVPAMVSSALSVAATAVFVLANPRMPAQAAGLAVGLMAAAAAFSLLACRRIELLGRRSYLLVLRESLRGDAATRAAEVFAELSNTDALTRLPNRRYFELELARRSTAAPGPGSSVALLMIDIDNFKRFNDRFGHPAGDDCLRQVAAVLQEQLRGDDFVARLGGEEFVVLLPDADTDQAAIVGERLRRAVERRSIVHDGVAGQDVVTVSIGLAASRDHADHAGVLASADRALYEAKRLGRNRLAVASAASAGPDRLVDVVTTASPA